MSPGLSSPRLFRPVAISSGFLDLHSLPLFDQSQPLALVLPQLANASGDRRLLFALFQITAYVTDDAPYELSNSGPTDAELSPGSGERRTLKHHPEYVCLPLCFLDFLGGCGHGVSCHGLGFVCLGRIVATQVSPV